MARLATKLKIRTALGGKSALSDALDEGGAPAGYTRSTINGVPATYMGRPVYDNGVNVIYL